MTSFNIDIDKVLTVRNGHPHSALFLRELDIIDDPILGYSYEIIKEHFLDHVKQCKTCSLAMNLTMNAQAKSTNLFDRMSLGPLKNSFVENKECLNVH